MVQTKKLIGLKEKLRGLNKNAMVQMTNSKVRLKTSGFNLKKLGCVDFSFVKNLTFEQDLHFSFTFQFFQIFAAL